MFDCMSLVFFVFVWEQLFELQVDFITFLDLIIFFLYQLHHLMDLTVSFL